MPDTVSMKDDLSTREAALAWSFKRIKKLGLVLVVSVCISPIASAGVVAFRYFLRAGELPPIGALVESSLLWAAIAILLVALVTAIIGVKYLKFASRVRPIIESGREERGQVAHVRFESRKAKSGVTHHKEILTVTLGDRQLQAAIEESEGTSLLAVAVGVPATVWTSDCGHVVAASGALFEATSPQGR